MDRNQIYVCIGKKDSILLLPYHEIEQDIKEMEELEGEMGYTVVGGIDVDRVIKENKRVFIVSWTDKKNTFRMIVVTDTDTLNYDKQKYKVRDITQEVRDYE